MANKTLEVEVKLTEDLRQQIEGVVLPALAENKQLKDENGQLRALLKEAAIIVMAFCWDNHKWELQGELQDPRGAHALLKRITDVVGAINE